MFMFWVIYSTLLQGAKTAKMLFSELANNVNILIITITIIKIPTWLKMAYSKEKKLQKF